MAADLPRNHVASILRRHARLIFVVALILLVTLLLLPQGSASTYNITQHLGALVKSSSDGVDYFQGFQRGIGCSFTSMDLYSPMAPACRNRRELLEAMSGGGRIGFDAPYQTRGCGMKWYTTEEICSILSRFEYIHLTGDSMIRHLAQAINVFIREDLVQGARATWRKGNPEGLDCYCHTLFDKHKCASEGFAALDTVEILQNDPASIKCGAGIAKIDFTHSSRAPPDESQIQRFATRVRNEAIAPEPPIKKRASKPSAFIFGHGGWNDFEIQPSHQWVTTFENIIENPSLPTADYLKTTNPFKQPPLLKEAAPAALFITPNAQGYNKEEFFIPGQNNIKLMHFEREMNFWLNERGWDVLGMWNLTIQSVSFDGTHATMESNLIKAMMVLNWLDALD